VDSDVLLALVGLELIVFHDHQVLSHQRRVLLHEVWQDHPLNFLEGAFLLFGFILQTYDILLIRFFEEVVFIEVLPRLFHQRRRDVDLSTMVLLIIFPRQQLPLTMLLLSLSHQFKLALAYISYHLFFLPQLTGLKLSDAVHVRAILIWIGLIIYFGGSFTEFP